MSRIAILAGDCRDTLKSLPDESVHCVVTSPPYWMLRDYGVAGQIGLEPRMEDYIAAIVGVFTEVRRVLRSDGTCWVNLGDTYSSNAGGYGAGNGRNNTISASAQEAAIKDGDRARRAGIPPKNLFGIPWRIALALQEDGWYLRCDIIWHKPNPMPESCRDRPTKAHEYLFLLSKSERYFYDAEAIREPVSNGAHARTKYRGIGKAHSAAASEFPGDQQRDENRRRPGVNPKAVKPAGWQTGPGSHSTLLHNSGNHGAGRNSRANIARDAAHAGRARRNRQNESYSASMIGLVTMRNRRTVWTIATESFQGAHFATFPTELVRPCILAGTKPGDMVLDHFAGSGTVGQVAVELGRKATLCELNPSYISMIEERTDVTPGLPI